jgi:PAS domain S-box-containing protein
MVYRGFVIAFCRHLFVLSILLSAALVKGQDKTSFKFSNISVDDGLSQSWVHCVLQDKYGFIWIGTDDGLNRYDGYEIVSYKHNTRDKNSIINNGILDMLEDSRGNLWIATGGGLNLYNRKSNTFVYDTLWPKDVILTLAEDELGNLWIGTSMNLFYYDQGNKKFTIYAPHNVDGIGIKDKGYLGSSFIRKVYIDRKKNVWIGTNEGLNLFVKQNKRFINYYNDPNDAASLKSSSIVTIFEDHGGRLWIGHDAGLDLFLNPGQNKEKAQFKHFNNDQRNSSSISRGAVRAITEYNNELWVGIDNGGINILKLSSQGTPEEKFTHIMAGQDELNGLSNNSIYSLYKDRQNNMWVGTYGNGINMYTRFANNFEIYRHDINNNSSISSNQVNSFLEDNDCIWIGTEKGLNRYDKKTKTFKSYTYNPNNRAGISSNAVWALHKDKEGNLWIGTWGGGLNKFNIKTGKFTWFQSNPNDITSIGSNNIFSIKEDSGGNLWLGTMGGGLNLFDTKTGKCVRFNQSNSAIQTDYVEEVTYDKDGNLWLANLVLSRYNKQTKQFSNYVHSDSDTSSISGSSILTTYCDSKLNIWIGTNGGLNLYIPETNNFRYYQVQDGLPDNAVKSIIEDTFGNLWLGTNKGLSKFIGAVNTPTVPNFKNYSREDGLQSKEFNRRSCMRATNGEMYFGGESGFVIFNPSTMVENTYIPNIVFTDFLLFNKPVAVGEKDSPLSESIIDAHSIKLSYWQSAFALKFVALNYVIPQKNQYAYLMEGFDKDWNYVGTKREATYTNLPAGTYKFRVKASNNDGKWNEKGVSIEIVISPPWWNSWWFRTIWVICLLAALAFGIVKLVNRLRALANQTILNERNQLKTLVNNIPDRIIIKDVKSRFVVLNNATIKYLGGKNENEFINKTDYDIFPKELADVFYKQEQRVLSTGKPIINEESIRLIEGREVALSTTKCPIINPKGETIGLVCIIRDITPQKKAEQKIIKQSEDLRRYNKVLNESNVLLEERQQQIEEQTAELMAQNDLLEEKQKYIQDQTSELEKSNEQLLILNATKDRFFSIIAHDLRNPFHAVKGLSEMLMLNYDKIAAEKAKRYIELIYSSSTTGSSLLENLLSWSRSQTGTVSFEPETIDLYDLVRQTFNFLDIEAQRKNIELKRAFEPQTYIFADVNMLQTIFRNLVYNAVKFTLEGGSVTVFCIHKGGENIITVKDTGIGISRESRAKLFDVHTNFSTAGTKHEQGTGLGLILCKEFVERHGGKIWVESEEGKGSEFKFTLPAIVG